MASPYMYDAAGELSEDVAVEMVATGRDCYQIRMTPNAQWLADKSRVCPVVIDPQVTTDSARTNIIDNYVLEGSGVQTIWTDLRPSGTSAVTSTYVSGNPAFTWTLTPDTSVVDQLLLLNSSAGLPANNAVRCISPGETLTTSKSKLVPSFVSQTTNSNDYYWYSSDPAVASVDDETGAITGNISGRCATIFVRIVTDSQIHIKSFSVYVTRVDLIPQQTATWCTLAAAQMFATNYVSQVTVTQESAITAVMGDNAAFWVAEPANVAAAAEYYIESSSDYSVDVVSTEIGFALSQDAVIGCIDEGHVIIAYRGCYPDEQNVSGRYGGHAVLIFGYDDRNSHCELLIYDPLPVNEGTMVRMSYEDFCNGPDTTGDDSDVYIWDAVIVADGWYFRSGQVSAYN